MFRISLNKILVTAFISTTLFACKKDGNPNNLPDVSPDDYAGKVDGYDSSDEIFPENLVAYWPFEVNLSETKSNIAPTTEANATLVDGGVKGKALNLNEGFLYYAQQFDAFKTDVFKSFCVSSWVKIENNGSFNTMLFQLARPAEFNGSLNFRLNTRQFPATNTDELKIHPLFVTVGGGTQDNINVQRDAPGATNYFPYVTPKIGMDKWVHLLINYNGSTGFFDIWANGIKAGAYASRGTGNSLFKSYEPGEVIIGANYNIIPGKKVNDNTDFKAMKGQIDELRVFNRALPDAHIKALYNLGLANK